MIPSEDSSAGKQRLGTSAGSKISALMLDYRFEKIRLIE
jgi:hypothetical protein